MTKFFALALLTLTGAACAQTPAMNLMPDGSSDMYVGLGLVTRARYEGAASRTEHALPVLQLAWSNGAFVAGMRAGIHLGHSPRLEYGPLLEFQARRSSVGDGSGLGGIGDYQVNMVALPRAVQSANRLDGLAPVHARLLGGGFLNVYLNPAWRATTSLLYGAGNARTGARLELGLQRIGLQFGAQHQLALGAGVSLANRSYNRAFFGVDGDAALRSWNAMYIPDGGLKDMRLGAHWNWTWSPAWLLSSSVQATHLVGSARRSPLVERPTNLTASTVIAFRF